MTGHVHALRPDRPVKPTRYDCASCAFACTPRAVSHVESNPRQHRAIKRVKGIKPKVWDLPTTITPTTDKKGA